MHTENLKTGKQDSGLLSIIIPIHNGELFLRECINSVLNQSYNNIEVLLIDDGSTDNSANICELFALKDSRVFYYKQDNKGVSAARNLGIYKSQGDFIAFVDSDDWIELNMYEQMLTAIDNYDIVACRYIENYNNGEELFIYETPLNSLGQVPYNYTLFFDSSPSVLANKTLYLNHIFGSICRLVFRKELLTSNNIIFDEKIKKAEDLFFLINCLLHVKKVNILDEYFYHYRINTQSSSHIDSSPIIECHDHVYKYHLLSNFVSTAKCDYKAQKTTLLRFKIQGLLRIVLGVIVSNEKYQSIKILNLLFINNEIALKITINDMFLLFKLKCTFKRIVLLMLIRFKCWGLIWSYVKAHST